MPEKQPRRGPELPRDRASRLVLAYGGFGAVVLVAYLLAGVFGWSVEAEEQSAVPPSVRQAPGGYRSYHLWHAGYQGGK